LEFVKLLLTHLLPNHGRGKFQDHSLVGIWWESQRYAEGIKAVSNEEVAAVIICAHYVLHHWGIQYQSVILPLM